MIGRIGRFLTRLLETRAQTCARIGHRQRVRTRRGYREPRHGDLWERRYVAVQIQETIVECQRCGKVLEVDRVDGYGLHGVTLDAEFMVELQRDGEVWIS